MIQLEEQSARDNGVLYQLDCERHLLGSVLRSNPIIDVLMGRLEPSDFAKPSHRALYQCFTELAAAGDSIGLIEIANHLGADEMEAAGGISAITGLFEGVPVANDMDYYIGIVKGYSQRRKLKAAGQAIIKLAYDKDMSPEDAVGAADAAIQSVAEVTYGDGHMLGDLLLNSLERFKSGKRVGYPFGIRLADLLLGGLKPKELFILGALPRVGKTAFAATAAEYIAKSGHGVIMFSVEMGKESMTDRILLGGAGIPIWSRGGYPPSDNETARALARASEIMNLPFLLDDNSGSSIEAICAKARRHIRKMRARGLEVGAVIIDHLHILHSDKKHESKAQEIGYISWQCKHLAKSESVPVMLLSQLNRESTKRPDTRPQLSDLRYSGDVEANADVAMLLHRPHVLVPANDLSVDHTEAWGLVVKHRNGPTGDVRMQFNGATMRYLDAGESL